MGGDEFVLLLHHGVDEDFFEKLLASIRQPLMVDGQSIHLTASLGVTRYPNDHVQGDVLLRHANQAMSSVSGLLMDSIIMSCVFTISPRSICAVAK